MIRHSRPREPDNDTAIAKARLRVAALQVSPLDVIRDHPWVAVAGMAAVGLTAGALVGGPPKTKVIYRDLRDGQQPPPNAKKEKKKDASPKAGGGLMGLVLGQATGVGAQILKGFVEKKFQTGGSTGESGQTR